MAPEARYNYERYSGLQRSQVGQPGRPQFNDPNRDWTADSKERVQLLFALRVAAADWTRAPKRGSSYDFSYAEGSYLYTDRRRAGRCCRPSQLPEVYNKLQQLHIDVRHRLSNHLAATFSYLYEPFRVYDFAFDPSVVDGIVQPSSLVLGYVYRPYTATLRGVRRDAIFW